MKHIAIFDGLRGVLALWVFTFHVASISGFMLPKLFDGRHAVSVFFVLSGFVISKLTMERNDSYYVFIVRRFFRLYPVYLVCLVIALLFVNFGAMPINFDQKYTFEHVISHLFMAHGFFPIDVLPGADSAILNPAWSVSVEWQFYIIAPIFFMLLRSRSRWGLVIFVLAIVISKRFFSNFFNLGAASILSQIPIFFIGIC
ncbi:MAG: acyltransferase [Aeromicrobium sp.]|nr:acyltransferase [Burkholderiales bacterium]